MSLKLQRCQRQHPLGDQSRSLSLVNCFGPAQIYLYVSVWLVPMPMVSSAICSPSPSGTNPAPFCETLGEVHQHFYARSVWLCCNHCVILVSGARYCSVSIYYIYSDGIRRPVSSGVQLHTGPAKLAGSLSLWALKHCCQQLVLTSLAG